MDELVRWRVSLAPDTFYYIPEFVSVDEESLLLTRVNEAPRPRWQQLARRRLQNWGGLPHPKGMLSEAIPDWLTRPMKRVEALGCFGQLQPNHVLVNEYRPGEGILPHADGPLFHPVISTVSLGSHALLDLYRPAAAEVGGAPVAIGSLLLERRSLLVVTGCGYSQLLHGIAERVEDVVTEDVFNRADRPLGQKLARQTRVSLTIRHVPKVLRVKLRL